MNVPTDVFPDARLVEGEGPTGTFMFVGEAPGPDEARSGRLNGRTWRLLDRLLSYWTELRREGVYVTNVAKHAAPGGRRPKAPELKKYLPSFYDELRAVQPHVIVTLGAPAAKVFDKTIKVTSDHGVARAGKIDGVWEGVLVPWFQPAFALASPKIRDAMSLDAKRLHAEVERMGVPEVVPEYELATDADVGAYLMQHWTEFGFDTETTSPRRGKVFATDEAALVGYSVSFVPRTGVYVPTDTIDGAVAGALASPLWTKICHNAKFEYKMLRKQGITLTNFHDTCLAAYVLGEARVGLKTLTKQWLGVQPVEYKEVTGGRDMSELMPEEIAEYAAADADHTARLWPLFSQRLHEEELYDLYTNIELPLVPVLAEMEAYGVGVDVVECKRVTTDLGLMRDRRREDVEQTFWEAGVEAFNINSHDQLAVALETLGAPLKKRTEVTKRFVVDVHALRDVRDWMPALIDPLLNYRKYVKMMEFATSFVVLRGPDGRLHTSWNQAAAMSEDDEGGTAPSTGRISASGPNLQQIPHHHATIEGTDWGYRLRKCIVARPGHVLLTADLGQEEPRIIAVMADDRTLRDAFERGEDIYRPATEALYERTKEAVDEADFRARFDAERYNAKQFFLAWYYGAGTGRVRKLDPSFSAADVKRGLALLLEAHPARTIYLDDTRGALERDGFATTLYGRKRWISKIWSVRAKEREEALREGANARVQGTAADILKIALVRIARALAAGFEARLVLTVHDEVGLEVPHAEVAAVRTIVDAAFADLLPGMELKLETYVGETWGDRKRI